MTTAVSAGSQVEAPSPQGSKPSLGRRVRGAAGRWLPPLAFAVGFLAVWQLYATYSGVPESSLPSPTEIFQAMVENRALLAENAWVTIQEIALGYVAAIIVGVGLAVLICSSRMVERAVYPWLVVSQMVPVPAIAPIIVIWTGFDIRPKIIVIALVSFFPIAVNTIDGLKAADPEMDDLLKTLGAGRWKRFRTVDFPAALPFIFSGLRVAAALSVIGAVFAEWVGSSAGLGYLILSFNNQTATAEMFAAVIVLAFIGLALFGVVGLLQKICIPWYHDARFEDPDMEPEGI